MAYIAAENRFSEMKYNKCGESGLYLPAVSLGLWHNFSVINDFENMKDTYYIKQNGTVTINFAHEQDDVICYPDLVKIKIALDTGEVLGMEAQSYFSSHVERKFAKPKISIEKARASINKNIEIIVIGGLKTTFSCNHFLGNGLL